MQGGLLGSAVIPTSLALFFKVFNRREKLVSLIYDYLEWKNDYHAKGKGTHSGCKPHHHVALPYIN